MLDVGAWTCTAGAGVLVPLGGGGSLEGVVVIVGVGVGVGLGVVVEEAPGGIFKPVVLAPAFLVVEELGVTIVSNWFCFVRVVGLSKQPVTPLQR